MEGSPQLPAVLLLGPPPGSIGELLSGRRFRLLKPWEEEDGVDAASGEPSDAFLAPHADAVRAAVCFSWRGVRAQLLALLPRLECVVTPSMGVNHIDMAECRRRGVVVANAGSVFCADTADYAIGLLIDVLRRVSAADRYVRSGRWPHQDDFLLGSKLGGKRVGIVGLGKIGLEIAKRLEAFGCIISYHSRTRKTTVSYTFYPSALDLARQSDVLIAACELTDETHHIINKDVLSALGKEGVVINIGRGGLIDQDELVRCLMQGEIGGAGLDVYENEPHVPPRAFPNGQCGVVASQGFSFTGILLRSDSTYRRKPGGFLLRQATAISSLLMQSDQNDHVHGRDFAVSRQQEEQEGIPFGGVWMEGG